MFEFTIVASGVDPRGEDFEARFLDAGCDDATVSFRNGHILLDFAREADSLATAIVSAVENASAAGATVQRVEPDPLVSLIEMADRSGMRRSAMTNYYKGHRRKGFPPPKARVTSHSPLWDWASVAAWLYRQDRLSRDEAIEAGILSAANEMLQSGRPLAGALAERAAELECAIQAVADRPKVSSGTTFSTVAA